jgi:hypothetical protein
VVEVGVLLAAAVVENVAAVGIRVGSMHDCKGHSLVSDGSIADGSMEPRGADVTRSQRRTHALLYHYQNGILAEEVTDGK